MSFRNGKRLLRLWCTAFAFSLFGTLTLSAPAFAQTCLHDEAVNAGLIKPSKSLTCTAGDVRVAQVTNVRDLNGQSLSSCIEGTTFSFVADFTIVTQANAANSGGRDNVGLYFQRDPTKPDALSGSCVDNIIAPQHPKTIGSTTFTLGSAGYQEFDASPDNCGDTASSVNPSIIDTIVVDNFLCEAPTGSTTLVLPNCTSWQTPGSSTLCQTTGPDFPYPFNTSGQPEAVTGTPSKCNCGIIPLPITPVTPSVIVQKACTTDQTVGPASFTQNPNTQTPVACNVGNGTTTEGGTATYHIAITNTTGTSGVTIDQICDSAYGNIFTATGFTPACPAGSAGSIVSGSASSCAGLDIPATGATTAQCTFQADHAAELTAVNDVVTVKGHADLNTSRLFGPTQSNAVAVTSTELPSSATVTPTFTALPAACVTERFTVTVHNGSGADEVETLTALNASEGQLAPTKAASILATTCGVPQTLAVGGTDYSCTFDVQVCSTGSAIGTITKHDGTQCVGLHHSETVTATINGDEGANDPVTQTDNTATVDVCFTTFTP